MHAKGFVPDGAQQRHFCRQDLQQFRRAAVGRILRVGEFLADLVGQARLSQNMEEGEIPRGHGVEERGKHGPQHIGALALRAHAGLGQVDMGDYLT